MCIHILVTVLLCDLLECVFTVLANFADGT